MFNSNSTSKLEPYKKQLIKTNMLAVCALATVVFLNAPAWATAFTPATNPNQLEQGGLIPSGYAVVDFVMSNGNWTGTLVLPSTAKQGDVINIKNQATYSSEVRMGSTDLPIDSLTLKTNETMKFVYDATIKKWHFLVNTTHSPNTKGSTIPASSPGDFLVHYHLQDGDWTPNIALPADAKDGQLAWVTSSATSGSKIDPQNMLYTSTWALANGDAYLLRYFAPLQKWVPLALPKSVLHPTVSQLPLPTKPKTEVAILPNMTTIDELILPEKAGDRDTLSVVNLSKYAVRISNKNSTFTGSMVLYNNKASPYRFVFDAQKNNWMLQSSPIANWTSANNRGNYMPIATTPVSNYNVTNATFKSTVFLPYSAKTGDQVLVRNGAFAPFNINSVDGNVNNQIIKSQEVVRFIRNERRQWVRDTNSITLLMVYSSDAAQQLGDAAMRTRMNEGLRLTNEALHNSNAKFFFQSVGLLKHKIAGTTLGDAITLGRTDPVVQNTRNQSKASAVYYEGIEDGCGLGWVNTNGNSAFNMISAGSLNCGVTVMRHELGHNMGLPHTADYPNYPQLGLVPDVMGGNRLPYYTNPNVFSPDLSLSMGVPSLVDGVSVMNRNAITTAKFR